MNKNDDITVKEVFKTLREKGKEHELIDSNKIVQICDEAKAKLLCDDLLIEVQAPINVVGDIHGQFKDLMLFLDENFCPEKQKYLFLGDYVDRGPNSIEVMTFLLCCKILYPSNIFLLRGNHETPEISALYGFQDEINEKYPQSSLYEKFLEVFQELPLAAVISERIFCVHGGLSKDLENVKSIKELKRPIRKIEENSVIQDLLWADPAAGTEGFTPSERGTSFTFGQNVADKFLKDNDFELICRAHQVVDNGFDFPFYPAKSVLTIFSAPNYCDEFNNKGAMLIISPTLSCTFRIVDPNNSDANKKS